MKIIKIQSNTITVKYIKFLIFIFVLAKTTFLIPLAPAVSQISSPSVEFLGIDKIRPDLPVIAFQIRETPSPADLTKTTLKVKGIQVPYKYNSENKIIYYETLFPMEKGNYNIDLNLYTMDGMSYNYSEIITIEDEFAVISSLPYPNPCTTGTITFRYNLSKEAENAEIIIYDLSENLIFKENCESGAGINEYVWNCSFEDGRPVPYGSYYYKIKASAYNQDSAKHIGRFTLIP
jgi:hypothetical protein